MERRPLSELACFGILAITLGCGGEQGPVATFTSDVVQRESCRVTDDGGDSCTREEVTLRLRVTAIEDEFDRVTLLGLPRDGESDRGILGALDSQGGYLFFDERVQANARTGCVLTQSVLLSLRVDDEAAPEQVGIDECIALVGRETRRTVSSAECDTVNDPPVPSERVERRRWQRAAGCESEGASAE